MPHSQEAGKTAKMGGSGLPKGRLSEAMRGPAQGIARKKPTPVPRGRFWLFVPLLGVPTYITPALKSSLDFGAAAAARPVR